MAAIAMVEIIKKVKVVQEAESNFKGAIANRSRKEQRGHIHLEGSNGCSGSSTK